MPGSDVGGCCVGRGRSQVTPMMPPIIWNSYRLSCPLSAPLLFKTNDLVETRSRLKARRQSVKISRSTVSFRCLQFVQPSPVPSSVATPLRWCKKR
jgi:hypothetical protein